MTEQFGPPKLYLILNNTEEHFWAWIGCNNMLFNIVDNHKQWGQHNIAVQLSPNFNK